jgi:hypothetical protein
MRDGGVSRSLPPPGDPQAYYKLLVGGPKPLRRGDEQASMPASRRDALPAPPSLTAAFRDAAERAGRRFAEARRRLAA